MKSLTALALIMILCLTTIDAPGQKICARRLKARADSMALALDPQSRLMRVLSPEISGDGRSSTWIYDYTRISGSKQVIDRFRTISDSVAYDSTFNGGLYGLGYLSRDWIDSDSALVLANLQGGSDFVAQHPRYNIWGYIGQGQMPQSEPEWFIYYDDSAGNVFMATVRATVTDVFQMSTVLVPSKYSLHQNYPNPFNPSTSISFDVPRQAYVRLSVHNLVGQEVALLADGVLPQGQHSARWQPENASSGIYFLRLQAGDFRATWKMVLIR